MAEIFYIMEGRTIYPIRQFREIFGKRSMPLLHIFIDRYKKSVLKEFVSFAKDLDKDLAAVENAVASPLSNGFEEETNSNIKTIFAFNTYR